MAHKKVLKTCGTCMGMGSMYEFGNNARRACYTCNGQRTVWESVWVDDPIITKKATSVQVGNEIYSKGLESTEWWWLSPSDKWGCALIAWLVGIPVLMVTGIIPQMKDGSEAVWWRLGIFSLIILLTVRYVPYAAKVVHILFVTAIISTVLYVVYRLTIAFAST